MAVRLPTVAIGSRLTDLSRPPRQVHHRRKPNTKLVLTINFGRFKSIHTGQFTAAGEATIYTEQIQVSMGGLMRLMDPQAKGMVRRSNAKVLENRKRILEQG